MSLFYNLPYDYTYFKTRTASCRIYQAPRCNTDRLQIRTVYVRKFNDRGRTTSVAQQFRSAQGRPRTVYSQGIFC